MHDTNNNLASIVKVTYNNVYIVFECPSCPTPYFLSRCRMVNGEVSFLPRDDLGQKRHCWNYLRFSPYWQNTRILISISDFIIEQGMYQLIFINKYLSHFLSKIAFLFTRELLNKVHQLFPGVSF